MRSRSAISYKRRVNQSIVEFYLLDTQEGIASIGSSTSRKPQANIPGKAARYSMYQ